MTATDASFNNITYSTKLYGQDASLNNITANGQLSVVNNATFNGIVTIQNNTSINGKLGIGTSSPTSIITAVLNGGSSPGEGWNSNWCVFGNQGITGSCVGIGYNNSTNIGQIACLAPSIGWRALQFSSKGINFTAYGGGTFAFTSGNVAIGQSTPSYALDVSGISRIGNNLYVLGDSSLNGFLNVSNTSTFQSDVYCNSRLNVANNTTLSSRLEVVGVGQFDNNVSILGSRLYCNADASFNGQLSVLNNASFNGNLQINRNTYMNGTLTCSGDLYVGLPYTPSQFSTLRTGYITCYTDCSSHNFWGDYGTIGSITTNYLSSFNCNLTGELHLVGGNPIVSMYTAGSSTGAYLWANNNHWNGQVGFAFCNDLASPYAFGYTNVNSMDFINNSGSANNSCWNFYSLGDGTTNGYPTIATAYNTIYNGGFAHQSDISIKQNVKNLNTLHCLDKITKIRLVNYQYIL